MARSSKRAVGSNKQQPEPLVELADPAPTSPVQAIDATALLANERILAVWCQTSILLQLGGFSLTQLGDSALRGPIGTLLILAGAFVAVAGYQRYLRLGQLIRGLRDDVSEDRRPLAQVSLLAGIAVLMAGLQIAGIW